MEILNKKFVELKASEGNAIYELDELGQPRQIGRAMCFVITDDIDEEEIKNRYFEDVYVEPVEEIAPPFEEVEGEIIEEENIKE